MGRGLSEVSCEKLRNSGLPRQSGHCGDYAFRSKSCGDVCVSGALARQLSESQDCNGIKRSESPRCRRECDAAWDERERPLAVGYITNRSDDVRRRGRYETGNHAVFGSRPFPRLHHSGRHRYVVRANSGISRVLRLSNYYGERTSGNRARSLLKLGPFKFIRLGAACAGAVLACSTSFSRSRRARLASRQIGSANANAKLTFNSGHPMGDGHGQFVKGGDNYRE